MRNVQLSWVFVPILLIVIVLPVNATRGSATGEWAPEITKALKSLEEGGVSYENMRSL